MKINYDLIGSIPDAEQYRNCLEDVFSIYEHGKMMALAKPKIGVNLTKPFQVICDAAAHFYGIEVEATDTAEEVIAEIRKQDAEIKAK